MSDHINRMIQKGRWVAVYPLGYVRTIDPDGSVVIKIDEQKAEIIRFIFDSYVSGFYSFSMIANEVNSRYNESLYKAKIENIIKRPFYYGMMKIKGELYPHNYGAIISKEVFDKAQEIASKRRGRWTPPINNKD